MKNRLMIIDGNSLVYRAFFALPQLETKKGVVTNGVYGFLTMYYGAIEKYKPTHIGIVFDKRGKTFRHEEYEDYKAGRAKMPDELSLQFPLVKEILGVMKVKTIEKEGFEADDLAGTFAKTAEKQGYETILVTGDKDYLQLVDESTKVVLTKKGITETETYDIARVEEEYGMPPKRLVDLMGLMGDPSDNIPGVPSIGPKTGMKLLSEYNTIEELYENIDDIKKGNMKNKLEEYKRQAYMSKVLATIVTDVPLEIGISDLKIEEPENDKLIELYTELEFKSLLKKVSGGEDAIAEVSELEKVKYTIIDSKERLNKKLKELKKEIYIKFSYENLGIDEKIVGVSLIINEEKYYIDFLAGEINIDVFIEEFEETAKAENIAKYGYGIKEEVVSFLKNGVDLKNIKYDAYIARYLLNPSMTNYDINTIAREYLQKDVMDIKTLLGTGRNKKTLSEIELKERADFFIREIQVVESTKKILEETITEWGMEELFYGVELPLTTVLGDMQYRGFKVDMDELQRLKIDINGKIEKLVKEIYNDAGVEFNLNSPKQLGEVLFEELNLPIIKKTKTGYSTAADVLEKLKSEHEIIEKILEYRQLAKLKSTYIEGLENVVDKKTNLVHSNFNQTITSTGRISSTEPNLQNIPIRTEEGRKIRKLFITRDENYKLVDADYSQIELRVLAHISDDEKLKEAFEDNIDIHTKTASEVFGVSIENVTPEMRSNAKAVNFGIVYGISDYGLSQNLNIARKKAKEYIDNYLATYPNVKKYMKDIVKKAKDSGYVETILNRRRYVPEVSSRNFNIRAAGERIAMNTPIQGSAADIIKLAMVKIYDELNDKDMRSKLILQVHDELIIETHIEELEEVKTIMKELMEDAIVLKVPLVIDLGVGDNWDETE